MKKLLSKNKLINTRINYYTKVHLDKMLKECKANDLNINNISDYLRLLLRFSKDFDFMILLYERDYKSFRNDRSFFLRYCLEALNKTNTMIKQDTFISKSNG
jgi:hypothetical protein